MTAASPDRQCTHILDGGRRCPTGAEPGGLCHVHDPAKQCGRPGKYGVPCRQATGGGPCEAHTDVSTDFQDTLFG